MTEAPPHAISATADRCEGNMDFDITPRERLRSARRNARLSVQALADRVGIAPTTVRAHESGQNNIRKEAATLYAQALNVEPEWLLFGTGIGPSNAPGLRSIPVLGEIRRGAWFETSKEKVPRYIKVEAEGYGAFELSSYIFNEWSPDFQQGAYLIVGSLNDFGWGKGGHVVLRRQKADLTEYSLRTVATLTNPPRLMLPAVPSVGMDGDPIDYLQLSPDEASIVGVVVGCYWMRRLNGAPLPVGSREELADAIERRDIR